MDRWFVVQTKSNQEQYALKKITDGGFFAYLPLYSEVTLNRKREPQKRMRPLFPSYAFVAHREGRSVGDIRHFPGIVGIVGCRDETVASLPLGWVEELRERVSSGQFDEALETMIPYVPGDRVEVVSGLLSGKHGVVLHNHGKRVVLLMTLLNGENRINLDYSAVTRI